MNGNRPFNLQPSGLLTGKNRDDLSVYPPEQISVGADASLTNAATQWIPMGSGLVTSLTNIAPGLAVRDLSITRAVYLFSGNAANVAGQTVQFFVRVNGAVVAVLDSGIPTTAGVKTRLVEFATSSGYQGSSPLEIAAGSRIDIGLEPSAALTAALVQIGVVLGG